MRLGINLGYWGTRGTDDLATMLALAQAADTAGYDIAWLAEVYGSDAPTLAAHLSAHTNRLRWGTAVMQIPARTPTMTAMTAATLDRITGGRFCLGLGVSGPQVSEGWHGVRFDDPLGRTREYVAVVRLALARKSVDYDGAHFQLPLPGGQGKALRLLLQPAQETVPIYLASIGPRNLELTGEIADGWLGIFVSPEHLHDQLEHLRAGRRAARVNATTDSAITDSAITDSAITDDPGDLDGFDVAASANLSIADDLDVAADRLRDNAALYVGGMGSRRSNFYNALACRMGYADAAAAIQRLYLDGRPRDAAATVPRAFIEQTALVGPCERIAARLHAYADAGVTTLNITPYGDSLDDRIASVHALAELMQQEGLR